MNVVATGTTADGSKSDSRPGSSDTDSAPVPPRQSLLLPEDVAVEGFAPAAVPHLEVILTLVCLLLVTRVCVLLGSMIA